MPKISVIIPVYNVEKTLRQCLDSIINQTYKDLEIICVNDVSTDSSYEILQEYKGIKVVNNEINSGLGITRNNGLKYATGEYIHFLDSDDWMELNAYELLLQKLENSPDIVYFLWNNIDVKNNKIIPSKPIDGIFPYRTSILEQSGVNAWHGLFKREFLIKNSLFFNDYRCMEDLEFSYKAVSLAQDVSFLNCHLLNYRTNNSNSLIGNFYKYPNCAIDSYRTIYEFSKILSDDERDTMLSLLLNSVLYRVTGSFVMNRMSLKELKDFTKSLDLAVFKKDLKTYKWFKMYEEINNSSPFMIKLRYKLKQVLKEKLYFLYEFLKDIKN